MKNCPKYLKNLTPIHIWSPCFGENGLLFGPNILWFFQRQVGQEIYIRRSVGASENVHPLKTIFGSSMTGAWLGEVQLGADSNTTVNSAPGNPPLHTLPGPSACTLRRFWLNFFLIFSQLFSNSAPGNSLHLARFLSLYSIHRLQKVGMCNISL